MKKYTCQQYILLNKEGILRRNFHENDISDKRTKYFGLKGANFSIGVPVFYELYFLEC